MIHVDKSWDRENDRTKHRKMVYFIIGDKPYKYDKRAGVYKTNRGFSRILYVGMTERKDATEPFYALGRKVESLFDRVTGLKGLEVRCISVLGRQRLSAADELETVCLHQFEQMFGRRPLGNEKTKGQKISDKRLEKLNERFGAYDVVRPLLREIGDQE